MTSQTIHTFNLNLVAVPLLPGLTGKLHGRLSGQGHQVSSGHSPKLGGHKSGVTQRSALITSLRLQSPELIAT